MTIIQLQDCSVSLTKYCQVSWEPRRVLLRQTRARCLYVLTPVQRDNDSELLALAEISQRNNSFPSEWQLSVFLTTEFIWLPVLLCLTLWDGELSMGVSYTLIRRRHRFAMKAIGHAHSIPVCRFGRDVTTGTRSRFRAKILITLTYKIMLSGINVYHTLRTE